MVGSVVAPLVSFGVSKLFSKSQPDPAKPLKSFKPTNINAGGLRSSFGGGTLSLTSTPERQALVGGLAQTFGQRAGEFAALRSQVEPGFGRLTTSRLREVENARSRTVGNLRQSLARRRVLGSSFGDAQIAQTEREFAEQAERVQAESFLAELELTVGLIDQQFQAAAQGIQTFLNELNLQADVATNLATQATSEAGANARALAELTAKQVSGAGQFFGQTFQPMFDSLGGQISEIFAGSG